MPRDYSLKKQKPTARQCLPKHKAGVDDLTARRAPRKGLPAFQLCLNFILYARPLYLRHIC